MIIPYQIIATFGHPFKDNGVDELTYYCPMCLERHGSPDTKGKLSVNTKSLLFHCFRCGYSGKLSSNKNDYNSNKIYQEDLEKDTDELIGNINEALDDDTHKFKLTIPIEKVTTNEEATKYLLDRGFTYEQMEYYDMRIGNRFKEFGRIIIPNQVDKLVYTDFYSARTYIGQTPKYHNPKIKKSNIVFNLHRIQEGSPIIIVEGALTAIAAGKRAVATLGKTIDPRQAALIAEKKPSVVYLNYDFGAEEFSHKACETLHKVLPNTPIYEVLMKDDRDAADLTHEEYAECIANAKLYDPLQNSLENLLDF